MTLDSIVVLGWIAKAAFWVLLFVGREEIGWKGLALFVGLWCAGWLGAPHVRGGPQYFMTLVALIDVVLVLVIFKGDVPIR